MFRTALISASALAVITSTACANEETAVQSAEEGATIVDATQVETRDDAKLYAESEFLLADLDQNGKVDKTEFLAYAAMHAPLADPLTEPSDGASIHAEGDADVAADASAEEEFDKISKGDEEITEDHMVETRVAQFDEADVNDDEKLDETERQTFATLTKAPTTSTAL